MINRSLYNGKEILGMPVFIWCFFKMIETPVQPAVCKLHGFLGIFIFRIGWRTFIKSHHDIGANGSFYIHYLLRAKKVLAPIDMALEYDALFIDLPVRCQRKYLEAPTVGKYWPVPVHKAV